MPKGMAACRFQNTGLPHGIFNRALNHRLMEMMSAPNTGLVFNVTGCCRKHPLPSQFPLRIRILPGQRIRKHDAASAVRQIPLMQLSNEIEMFAKRRLYRIGKHGHPVLPALAVAQSNLSAIEIKVLNTELQRFGPP
jgi:hypothetical protein